MNKVIRKKQTTYTTISNVFLRDKNLSIKAKGFLAVVMGLPEKWDFSIKGICSILKEGKTAIYNVIQELKEYHYCETNDIRDEKGLYIGLDYVFYEEPHIDNQQQEYPYPENQDTDNEPQYNKDNNKKKDRIKETRNKEERDKSLSKKKAKFDVRADLSYVNAEFTEIWNEWLDYKDAINKQYKTQKGANMQYSSMIRMSDNNPVLANAIVKRSIEMSWDGMSSLTDKQKKFFLSDRSPYYSNDIGGETKPSLPEGWTQERYDMFIRNGYTITPEGRVFLDGKEYK